MQSTVLEDAFKTFTLDQDKILPPEETVRRFREKLNAAGLDILQETRRIDNGRIGIAAQSLGIAQAALDQLEVKLNLDETVSRLSVAQHQLIEIAKALSRDVKLLILDEPTTGISASQRAKLFETLRILVEEGMSVIFVSHKLEEVEALCGRVAVMRRGKLVGGQELPCLNEQLVELMFGQVPKRSQRPADRSQPAAGTGQHDRQQPGGLPRE